MRRILLSDRGISSGRKKALESGLFVFVMLILLALIGSLALQWVLSLALHTNVPLHTPISGSMEPTLKVNVSPDSFLMPTSKLPTLPFFSTSSASFFATSTKSYMPFQGIIKPTEKIIISSSIPYLFLKDSLIFSDG